MVLHEELSEKKWGSGTIVGHYQDQVSFLCSLSISIIFFSNNIPDFNILYNSKLFLI